MNTKSAKARRHSWWVVLLLLVILPFVPELVIYAIAAVAKAHGCQLADDRLCIIAGVQVGDVIAVFLRGGVYVAAAFAVGITAVWLVFCYLVIGRGWTGLLSRLLLVSFVSLIFGYLPYQTPKYVMESLANTHCQPDARGLKDSCHIFGGDVGIAADETVIVPFLGWSGGAIALGVFVIYVIWTAVRLVAARRVSASAQ